MEQNYADRQLRESRQQSGSARASEHSGYASNSALTAAMGGDTPPDPNLGSRMVARMAATFGPGVGGVVQMKPIGERDRVPPVTGSAAAIRGALERKSSVSLDDVHVHYNSPKPAEIGALAYARGSDVFMGPGQEKYLGHELTHVVQQRQGLVRSTGTVGGMPVNTSAALESAADHMQVSAAPAAAPAGGGVVQGVFVDAKGKKLSEKDVEAMISMMEGSLESHGEAMDKIADKNRGSQDTVDNVNTLGSAYKERKSSVRERFLAMMRDKKKHRAEDILSGEVNQAQQAAVKQNFNPDMMNRLSFFDTFAYSLSGTQTAAAGQKKIDAQNTRQGYLDTEKKFSLAKKKMAGVEQIQDFDPSKDHADELLEARMGNSNTYSQLKKDNPAEYEKKKGEFAEAAEMAREGAVRLKESEEDVGFSDLYSLFSGLNSTVRKGDPAGGKLRGKFVSAGDINAVGSGQLPEDVFRTFSTIAAQMNQIKKEKDRELQKTQAIQLAAFAYQMTVSEHMFNDGNGRTCRLFSDSILQSFGLPPHIPQDSERTIAQTMGKTARGKPWISMPAQPPSWEGCRPASLP